MILAQTEASMIGLIVQGGFAALCGFMVYSQERRMTRDERRRDAERQNTGKTFEAKDGYIRELVASNQSFLENSTRALEQSTEVAKQIIAVIKKCTGKEI